jgi:hypothetical protein
MNNDRHCFECYGYVPSECMHAEMDGWMDMDNQIDIFIDRLMIMMMM